MQQEIQQVQVQSGRIHFQRQPPIARPQPFRPFQFIDPPVVVVGDFVDEFQRFRLVSRPDVAREHLGDRMGPAFAAAHAVKPGAADPVGTENHSPGDKTQILKPAGNGF